MVQATDVRENPTVTLRLLSYNYVQPPTIAAIREPIVDVDDGAVVF